MFMIEVKELDPNIRKKVEKLIKKIEDLTDPNYKSPPTLKKQWEDDLTTKLLPLFEAIPKLESLPIYKYGISPEFGKRSYYIKEDDIEELDPNYFDRLPYSLIEDKDIQIFKAKLADELDKVKLQKPRLKDWYGEVDEAGEAIELLVNRINGKLYFEKHWDDMQ